MFASALYLFPIWWLYAYMGTLLAADHFLSGHGMHLYEIVHAENLCLGLWLGFIGALLVAGRRWFSGEPMRFFFGMLGCWLLIFIFSGFTQGALMAGLERAAGKPIGHCY